MTELLYDVLCCCVLIGTEKVQVRSYFAHREDWLQSRVENCRNGQIQECFGPGQPRGLKGERWAAAGTYVAAKMVKSCLFLHFCTEHVHHESKALRSANRTMLFYS